MVSCFGSDKPKATHFNSRFRPIGKCAPSTSEESSCNGINLLAQKMSVCANVFVFDFHVQSFINSSWSILYLLVSTLTWWIASMCHYFYVLYCYIYTKDKISSILMCILFIRWYLVLLFSERKSSPKQEKKNTEHDQFKLSIRPPRAVSQQIADILSQYLHFQFFFCRHTIYICMDRSNGSVELI